MRATYQTRLDTDDKKESILKECAHYLSYVERRLFADICKGKELKELKNIYLLEPLAKFKPKSIYNS